MPDTAAPGWERNPDIVTNSIHFDTDFALLK